MPLPGLLALCWPVPRDDDCSEQTLSGRAGTDGHEEQRRGPADTGRPPEFDPAGPSEVVVGQLRTRESGLSEAEAANRLLQYGPNVLTRRESWSWWRVTRVQFTHPLAILLELATVLSFVSGNAVLGWTVLAVLLLNAGFALLQELQAERSVEALSSYMPQHATVVRGGVPTTVEATMLVPGDVLVVSEGQRISADARIPMERLVTGQMLLRAWALLGVASAALTMAAFFFTLLRGGWAPGDPTGPGSPLHAVYLQATTASFAAIVACQIGTAFAARTDRVSLFAIGLATNPLLLAGIAFEVAFTALLVYLPVANHLLGTAPLPWPVLVFMAPFPVLVWAVDEIYRAVRRTSHGPADKAPATLRS